MKMAEEGYIYNYIGLLNKQVYATVDSQVWKEVRSQAIDPLWAINEILTQINRARAILQMPNNLLPLSHG